MVANVLLDGVEQHDRTIRLVDGHLDHAVAGVVHALQGGTPNCQAFAAWRAYRCAGVLWASGCVPILSHCHR